MDTSSSLFEERLKKKINIENKISVSREMPEISSYINIYIERDIFLFLLFKGQREAEGAKDFLNAKNSISVAIAMITFQPTFIKRSS